VTGSGSGIGKAIAERLAAEGCIVGVFDLNADAAKSTASSIVAAGGKRTRTLWTSRISARCRPA
jgi:NAD(P)-dependent dehydrogenase (short-subunit alcohol dehydrogenase family)